MARYSDLVGRRVEVHYRAGDIVLPASGILVADSGRSIFLEQSLVQRGQTRHFRWEIPYPCIVRLAEKPEPEVPAGNGSSRRSEPAVAETEQPGDAGEEAKSAAHEKSTVNPLSVIFPRPQRSNI